MQVESSTQVEHSPRGTRKTNVLFQGGFLLCILSFLVLTWQIYHYIHEKSVLEQQTIQAADIETDRVANQLDSEFKNVMSVARTFADDLTTGKLQKEEVIPRIQSTMGQYPQLNGIIVAFVPHTYDPNVKLYAPYFIKSDKGLQQRNIETVYDYTNESDPQTEWYFQPQKLKEGFWSEPHYGKVSQKLLAGYSTAFYTNDPATNSQKFAGVVLFNYSFEDVKSIMSSLNLGKTGYGFMLSKEGTFVSHPIDDYAKNEKKIFDVAEELHNDQLKEIGEKAVKGEKGKSELINELTGQSSWVFYEPIPSTGWSISTVFFQEETSTSVNSLRQQLIWITINTIVFLILLIALLFRIEQGIIPRQWKAVTMVSIIFLVGIAFTWYLEYNTPYENKNSIVIVDQASLDKFLEEKTAKAAAQRVKLPTYVPTGMHIQSVEFSGTNNVILTGYLWQKYTAGVHDGVSKGVVFPEATTTSTQVAYQRKDKDTEIIGYNFKVTLRQDFIYKKYPFDNKEVNVRVWHKDFDQNIILTPDLSAYKLMNPFAKPGMEKDIALPGWQLQQSFFNYHMNSYNSNFGISKFVNQDSFPDLYFTFTMKRNFINPFISNLLPIFVISFILFALLLMVTKNKPHADIFGFKTSGILGSCSGLFFSVLLAHAKLRGDLAVSDIIYLEYFYFFVYTSILSVALNAFLYSKDTGLRVLHYNDNIIPKLLYWPILLGFMLLATICVFY